MDQDLPSLGRAGQVDYEPGSCATAVHLASLLSRTWDPYGKWRGTALRRLPVGEQRRPLLEQVHGADAWRDRQRAVAGPARALPAAPAPGRATGRGPCHGPFRARPLLEMDPALTSGLLDAVQDPAVRALPHGVGCIEQWVDGVDVLVVPQRRRAPVRAVLAAG